MNEEQLAQQSMELQDKANSGVSLIGMGVGTIAAAFLVYKYTDKKWWKFLLAGIGLSSAGYKIGQGIDDLIGKE